MGQGCNFELGVGCKISAGSFKNNEMFEKN
jgi:hypothetical protein